MDVKIEWICWMHHPVPDDVKGILIKYSDGIYPDRYDSETGKRKYRHGQSNEGWKFMERSDPNDKSIQARSEVEEKNIQNILGI